MHRTSGITVIALLVLLVTARMPSVFGVAAAAEEQQFIFAPTDPPTPETPTWYLAEGYTAWGFSTYVNIESPNDTEVTARVTYMNPAANTPSGKGVVLRKDIKLPAMSQTILNAADVISFPCDFSTKVECLEGKSIAVDRTMVWTGKDARSQEGHCSIGVSSPSNTWYLPEGSSNWGFETWTLVENPNNTDANVILTYMAEGRGAKSFTRVIPADSRVSYSMATDIGQADASIKVESDRGVIAERSVYRNDRREGSCSIGATAPSEHFYLPREPPPGAFHHVRAGAEPRERHRSGHPDLPDTGRPRRPAVLRPGR